MGSSKMFKWCVKGCGKRVTRQAVSPYHPRPYMCSKCGQWFRRDELISMNPHMKKEFDKFNFVIE